MSYNGNIVIHHARVRDLCRKAQVYQPAKGHP
jgi:hypothetical protein